MAGKHPVLVAISGTIAAIGVISSLAGILWYFEEDRLLNQTWLAKDEEWNSELLDALAEVRSVQSQMQKELAKQSQSLDRILEDHRRAISQMSGAMLALAIELGTHAGHHEFADAMREELDSLQLEPIR